MISGKSLIKIPLSITFTFILTLFIVVISPGIASADCNTKVQSIAFGSENIKETNNNPAQRPGAGERDFGRDILNESVMSCNANSNCPTCQRCDGNRCVYDVQCEPEPDPTN